MPNWEIHPKRAFGSSALALAAAVVASIEVWQLILIAISRFSFILRENPTVHLQDYLRQGRA